MNNKELQMTTTMPSMKKSLLAIAVAGTMAMSGGAYAANDEIIGADAANATALVSAGDGTDILTNAATANGVVTEFAQVDANASGVAGATLAYASANIDHSATVFVYDSDTVATDMFLIKGATDVATEKTLTLKIGEDKAGANLNAVNVKFGAAIETNAAGVLNIITNATSVNAITFANTADLRTGTVTLGNVADSVTLGGGKTMTTGGIIAGTDGYGVVTLSTGVNTTITGDIGSSSKSIATLNVETNGDVDAVITGDVFTNTLAFNHADTAATSSVAITGAANKFGAITTAKAGVLGSGTGDVVLISSTGDTTTSISGNIGTATNFLNLVQIKDAADGNSHTLTFSGSAAQSVYADDLSGDADDEDINITNTAGVTFFGTVGAAARTGVITLGSDGVSSSASFNGAVTAESLVMGAVGTSTVDTYSLNFAAAADYSVTGAISGAATTDTTAINVTGTNTVTFATDMGANIDTITVGSVDGANGLATFTGGVASGSIVLGTASGSTADTNTLTFASILGETISGAITGADSADTNAVVVAGAHNTTSVVTFSSAMGAGGNIDTLTVGGVNYESDLVTTKNITTSGLTTIQSGTSADTATLTMDTDGANALTLSTGGIVLDGVGVATEAVLTLTNTSTGTAGTIGVTGDITAQADGDGIINIGSTTLLDTTTATLGKVGTTTHRVGAININGDSVLVASDDLYTDMLTFNTNVDSELQIDTAGLTIGAIMNAEAASDGLIDVNQSVTFGTDTDEAIGSTNKIGALTIAADKTATMVGAGALNVAAMSFEGTGAVLKLSGAKTVTGTIDGTGTLDIDAATTLAGVIGGTTALTAIDIADGVIVTLGTGTTAISAGTTTFNSATSEIDAGVASTITGNLVAASNGFGILDIDENVSVVGTIGSSSAKLAAVEVVTAKYLRVSGDYNATLTTLEAADAVLTFNGTTDQTVNGLITGTAKGDGDLTVTNTLGTVTFNNAIGFDGANELDNVTMAVGSKTVFNSTVEAASMSVLGTTTVEDKVTLTGALAVGNGSTITLGSGIVAGETVFATANGNAELVTTSATVNLPQTFNTGTITLIDAAAAYVTADSTADAAKLTLVDGVLATYAAGSNATDGSKLDIVATAKTAATLATELSIDAQNATALQNANTSLTTGDTAGHAAMNTVLIAGGVALQDATEQMQPDAGAANGAALAAVGAVNNVINSRNTNTRVAFNSLGKQSGVSTGDAANDIAVWAQIFGSTATQEKLGNVDGYDADNMGVVVGWETEKSGDLMGFSMSYSDTDVDGKSAAKSHTDTTAVQASVYGTYNDSTDYMFGYASGNNDTARSITFGGLNLTAKGNYHSDIVMAKVGHSFDSMGAFTPRADLSMTSISNEGYTETGANNLNLTVASSDNTIVTARVGGEFATKHVDTDGSMMIPRASVMFGYDLANDGASTTANYAGGSTFVTTGADPKKASVEFGAGVDYVSDDSTVSVDFNANVREAYDSMTGAITFKSKF